MAISRSSPASSLLWNASLMDKPVHVSRLRAYCAGPADVADKLRTADRMGIKVKGFVRFDEQAELLKLRGGSRVLTGLI